MTLRATLFDMDGLLIDSEVLWHEAEVEVFGSLGVPISEAEDRSTKGMFVNEVVQFWYGLYPWTGRDESDVVELLLERVGELVEQKGRLLPGALRAVELAAARGPVALASSTPLALIYRCLDHFGLRDRFAAVSSAQFEVLGKPHPAVFLTAAGALGVRAPECLVIEDSAAGVLAAKAARMTVVAVPTAYDRGLSAFALADLVLRSLEELSTDWLDARFSTVRAG
ncbi:MAG: hexitol phosphatase HxpB [Acidimicrobiales bacterium]